VTTRILFVAPRVPFPPNIGWNQRMFHSLRALSAVGDVDLVCGREEPFADVDLEPLERLCRSVRLVDLASVPDPPGPGSRAAAVQRYVLARHPTHIAQFPARVLADTVEPLTREADLIWAVRLGLAEWLTRRRERTFVDLDDFESVKQAQSLPPRGFRPWNWLLWLDNERLRRRERTAPRRYGRCVVCSAAQRGFFPGRLRERVLVMPNGFPRTLLAYPRRPPRESTIVFVGTMDYKPNVDAAVWLAKAVFPSIVRRVPAARLLLVGHDTRHRLRPLADGRRIVATGSVADVAPLVGDAAVSVAPIRVGSGTRIKILEALALGVPVVSTTLGAEGLDLVPGREILLADAPEAFADAVVRLLTDPATRGAMADAGRAAVARAYDWEGIEARLADEVRGWLATRR
jgi:polysaccharide biosynthesis protein PslH